MPREEGAALAAQVRSAIDHMTGGCNGHTRWDGDVRGGGWPCEGVAARVGGNRLPF